MTFGVYTKIVAATVAAGTGMFAQVDFSHTITLGSMLVALVLLGAVGYLAVRGKSTERAEQTARDWRDNYLAEKERAESLDQQVQEQRALKHAARNEVAALQKLTDLSEVLLQITEVRSDIDRHFQEITATQAALTGALQAIATKIEGSNK